MRLHRAFATLSALFLAADCASFTSRPPFPDWAGPLKPLPVRLTVTEREMQLEDGRWADRSGSGELAHSVTKRIHGQDWVEERRYDESAPLLDVRITNYHGDGPNFASVLTACLVPGTLDNRITVDVSLSERDGEVMKCAREIEVRTWYQTFLIVLYPLFSPRAVRAQATEALALQCVADVMKQSTSAAAH